MNDGSIERELRRLPREVTADGFTDEVVARLERPLAGASRRPAPRRRLAAAVLALAALPLGWRLLRQVPPSPALAELEELRAEHAALSDELRRLRSAAPRDDASLLYLAGDEQVDLVLDLERLSQVAAVATPEER